MSWFKFSHEAAELRDWMLDIEKVVDSEDCGTDLEHAQMLLNKFEDFALDLVSSEDRVVAINDLGQELVEVGHSQAEVRKKLNKIKNELPIKVCPHFLKVYSPIKSIHDFLSYTILTLV